MESALSKGCTLKLQNFEGPFDLLFHLLEKNKIDIYDIPINEITDQYMEYLFAMREMDMEIASEFLVMAATLLHIKSKMLLPDTKLAEEEETDPREELIIKLVEYKKYKEMASELKEREDTWEGALYRLPEFADIKHEPETLDMDSEVLASIYAHLLRKNKEKMNSNAGKIRILVQREQVSIKSKIAEIIGLLVKKGSFVFSEVFSLKKRSKIEVVTGFLAILELAKMRKLRIEQKKRFSKIFVFKNDGQEQEKILIEGVADGS